MVSVEVASESLSCYFDASWQSGAMEVALGEAKKAADLGEVPVGAALFVGGQLVAAAHNEKESRANPLAHAECTALLLASEKLGCWRLKDAALVVTLEPCLMCMGALIQARVGVLVYGAEDIRAGAAGTLYDVSNDPRLNHRIKVFRGVRREESATLLRGFFEARRD